MFWKIVYLFVYYFLLKITRRFFPFQFRSRQSLVYLKELLTRRSSQLAFRNCNPASTVSNKEDLPWVWRYIPLSSFFSSLNFFRLLPSQSLFPSLSANFLFDQHLDSSFIVTDLMPNGYSFSFLLVMILALNWAISA